MFGSRTWLLLCITSYSIVANFSIPISELQSLAIPKIVINNTDGTYCILATLKISLTVGYNTESNETIFENILLPSDVHVIGFCNNKEFLLNFEWASSPNTQQNSQLNITWANITNGTNLKSVTLKMFKKNFSAVSTEQEEFHYFTFYLPETFLPLPDGSYFKCRSGLSFQDAATRNTFRISGKYQLGELKNDEFHQESQKCAEDESREETSDSSSESSSLDTVREIAGGVIAALVLIALLIGFGLHYYGMSGLGYGSS